MKQVVHISDIH